MKTLMLVTLVAVLFVAALAGLSPPTQKQIHPSIASVSHIAPVAQSVGVVSSDNIAFARVNERAETVTEYLPIKSNEPSYAEVNAVARSGSHSFPLESVHRYDSNQCAERGVDMAKRL